MAQISIDLERTEERHCILEERAEEFIQRLNFLQEINFSDKPVVQTIYFNNDDAAVPFGYSLKARLYLPDFPENPATDPNETMIFEIKNSKSDGPKSVKKKFRKNMSLQEIEKFLQNPDDKELEAISALIREGNYLLPYICTIYKRSHFVPRNEKKELRVTLDEKTKYYYLNLPQPVQVGKESFLRVEIKKIGNPEEYQRILELLKEFEAIPLISKKDTGFSMLKVYREAFFHPNPYKLETETEIEAKFQVPNYLIGDILLKIKKMIREGQIPGFVIRRKNPYTETSANINVYYIDSETGNEAVKFLFKGNKFSTVYKDNQETRGTIIKRGEHKKETIPITKKNMNERVSQYNGTALFLGEIYRLRKKMDIESDTRSLYQICADMTGHKRHKLNQLEIEYGGSLEPRREEEIINEIKYLARIINEKFPGLIAQPTSKLQWLKSVI
ncbi:hypothetical protein KY309_02325 [Candidatus Woesearchaeota archaeon]|nr:hypothetical protein [Candidatus Woesearchaeota archaeon]MBW3016423.1 hypothetical protein [Candidatus Woesearchaeota archaeon]